MFEDFYFSPRQSGSQNKGGVIQLITDNQIAFPHQSGYVGGVCSKTHSKSYCCSEVEPTAEQGLPLPGRTGAGTLGRAPEDPVEIRRNAG